LAQAILAQANSCLLRQFDIVTPNIVGRRCDVGAEHIPLECYDRG